MAEFCSTDHIGGGELHRAPLTVWPPPTGGRTNRRRRGRRVQTVPPTLARPGVVFRAVDPAVPTVAAVDVIGRPCQLLLADCQRRYQWRSRVIRIERADETAELLSYLRTTMFLQIITLFMQ